MRRISRSSSQAAFMFAGREKIPSMMMNRKNLIRKLPSFRIWANYTEKTLSDLAVCLHDIL